MNLSVGRSLGHSVNKASEAVGPLVCEAVVRSGSQKRETAEASRSWDPPVREAGPVWRVVLPGDPTSELRSQQA